jgi:hypothetical protein
MLRLDIAFIVSIRNAAVVDEADGRRNTTDQILWSAKQNICLQSLAEQELPSEVVRKRELLP